MDIRCAYVGARTVYCIYKEYRYVFLSEIIREYLARSVWQLTLHSDSKYAIYNLQLFTKQIIELDSPPPTRLTSQRRSVHH